MRGTIGKIYFPREHKVQPLSDRITVTFLIKLGSKKKTLYIKLESKEELDSLNFSEGEKMTIKGTLRPINDKIILTQVSRIK